MSTNHLRHAQQRLRQIAADWPADPLRPNLQLKTFLSALADHPALTANAVAATNALQRNQVSRRVSGLSFDDFVTAKIKLNHHLLEILGPTSTNGVATRINAATLRPAEGGL